MQGKAYRNLGYLTLPQIKLGRQIWSQLDTSASLRHLVLCLPTRRQPMCHCIWVRRGTSSCIFDLHATQGDSQCVLHPESNLEPQGEFLRLSSPMPCPCWFGCLLELIRKYGVTVAGGPAHCWRGLRIFSTSNWRENPENLQMPIVHHFVNTESLISWLPNQNNHEVKERLKYNHKIHWTVK